jgi:hypothetical protein
MEEAANPIIQLEVALHAIRAPNAPLLTIAAIQVNTFAAVDLFLSTSQLISERSILILAVEFFFFEIQINDKRFA